MLNSQVEEGFADGLQVNIDFHAHVLFLLCLIHLVDFNELLRFVVQDELENRDE